MNIITRNVNKKKRKKKKTQDAIIAIPKAPKKANSRPFFLRSDFFDLSSFVELLGSLAALRAVRRYSNELVMISLLKILARNRLLQPSIQSFFNHKKFVIMPNGCPFVDLVIHSSIKIKHLLCKMYRDTICTHKDRIPIGEPHIGVQIKTKISCNWAITYSSLPVIGRDLHCFAMLRANPNITHYVIFSNTKIRIDITEDLSGRISVMDGGYLYQTLPQNFEIMVVNVIKGFLKDLKK